MYSLGLALLGDAFPPAELAPANTLYVIMLQLGVLIGPALSGAVMQGIGVGAFPPMLAIVTLVLPLAMLLTRRRLA
jgi:predicted MFS family arabinose efflux permease